MDLEKLLKNEEGKRKERGQGTWEIRERIEKKLNNGKVGWWSFLGKLGGK